MKTNVLGLILIGAMTLPALAQTQTPEMDMQIDPAVIKCFITFENIQQDAFLGPAYAFGLGHQLGLCLQDQGLSQAVNSQVTGASRIQTLSTAIGKNLPEFSKIIMSILKRP